MIDPKTIFPNYTAALTELVLVYNDPSLHHLRGRGQLAVAYLKELITSQQDQLIAMKEMIRGLKAEVNSLSYSEEVDEPQTSTELVNPAIQLGRKKRS